MNSPVIGIDLGTTNTCVAVLKNDSVHIIKDEKGKRTFPSMVCFMEEEIKIGSMAQDLAHQYMDTTVYGMKRFIGSRYNDKTTWENKKSMPFNIINKFENPAVLIKDKEYYPEQISAMVLKHAKKIAEGFLGCDVTRAVVTVPAYFNNCQRQATKDAAIIAGLTVVRIINEPTAAALAFGWDNKSEKERTVLVYDFGGGTFDVSIVRIGEGTYKVIAIDGNTHLGGVDIDENLVNHFSKQFDAKYGTDIKSDTVAMRRLRTKSSSIKEKLSFHMRKQVELPSLYDGHDFNVEISRETFEELNTSIFKKTVDIVDACLKEGKIMKSEITDVVLVGGSTRIPRVQKMLSDYFDGKKHLQKTINPDEAVAYGAAIQGSIINEDLSALLNATKITDVTPMSLGRDVIGDELVVMIPRNATIPFEYSQSFQTVRNNQETIRYDIYQGESKKASENHLLGSLQINSLPLRPAGEVKSLCTFSIDADGILHVQSVIEGTELQNSVDIQFTENRLAPEEMERIMSEVQCS